MLADTPRDTPRDRLADNVRHLHAIGHPWAAFAVECAEKTGTSGELYMDRGQWAALAYAMTGEQRYAAKAIAKVLPDISIENPVANFIREWFVDFALMYGWLAPALTPEQDATYRKGLNRWCEFCFAINTPQWRGGWRFADSDQTIGQFFGVTLADQHLRAGWTERPEYAKARDTVRGYCKMASGGEFIEGEAYNLGTLKLLLSGAYGAGIERFPEVAALVPELAKQQLANLTPDLRSSYQWGDEENPGNLLLHKRVPLLAMLAGLTGDAELHAAIDGLTADQTVKDYLFLGWRAIYFYRPPTTPKATGFLRAGGHGHFRYKRDAALFGCHFPERLGVDHAVKAFGDFRLYLDGEWVITHPMGYGGLMVEGESHNADLFAGLSAMAEREVVNYRETPDGCEIVGRTHGPYYPQPYWDAPGEFASGTRTLRYTFPGKVEVRDVFAGKPPERVERYRAADQKRMAGAPLWQQVFHCPVEPTMTPTGFEWKTAGGKTVKLTAKGERLNVSVRPVREALADQPGTYVRPEQLTGYQIRLASDEPACEMVTVIEVA